MRSGGHSYCPQNSAPAPGPPSQPTFPAEPEADTDKACGPPGPPLGLQEGGRGLGLLGEGLGGCRGFGEGLRAAGMWRGGCMETGTKFSSEGQGKSCSVALMGWHSGMPGLPRDWVPLAITRACGDPTSGGSEGPPCCSRAHAGYQRAVRSIRPRQPGRIDCWWRPARSCPEPRRPVVGNSAGLGGASRKRAPQRGTARWVRPAAGPRDPGPMAMRALQVGAARTSARPGRPVAGRRGPRGTRGEAWGGCTAAGRTRLLSRYPRGHPGKVAPGQAGVGTGAHRALPSLGVLGAAGWAGWGGGNLCPRGPCSHVGAPQQLRFPRRATHGGVSLWGGPLLHRSLGRLAFGAAASLPNSRLQSPSPAIWMDSPNWGLWATPRPLNLCCLVVLRDHS